MNAAPALLRCAAMCMTGSCVHGRSRFKCDALKLAMIKNQHLAQKLFGGKVYDCVCLYEPASMPTSASTASQ